jgi:hypothetical protein
MGIGAFQTVPRVALFESNIRTPSALSAELNGHMPQPRADTPIIPFSSSYFFSPTDLTEDGRNNALLFDFRSYEVTQLPTFFRVFARGPTGIESYEAHAINIRQRDAPFTAAIPFSNFALRGGGAATPNFSTLNQLIVNFYFLRPREDVYWSFDLDRIRIGTMIIPEPSSASLCVLGMLYFTCPHVSGSRPHLQ